MRVPRFGDMIDVQGGPAPTASVPLRSSSTETRYVSMKGTDTDRDPASALTSSPTLRDSSPQKSHIPMETVDADLDLDIEMDQLSDIYSVSDAGVNPTPTTVAGRDSRLTHQNERAITSATDMEIEQTNLAVPGETASQVVDDLRMTKELRRIVSSYGIHCRLLG